MERLLAVRDTVMSLLEQARIDKYVKSPYIGHSLNLASRLIRSSLEAGVDVIIPGDLGSSNDGEPPLLEILQEQGKFLKWAAESCPH